MSHATSDALVLKKVFVV